MALVYDLLTVLILVIFFIVGFKKGFIKSVLSLVCFIVSAVVSLFLASHLAQPIYEMCFKESVTEFIESNIDKVDVTSVVNDYLLKNAGVTADEKTVKSIIGTEGDISENIMDFADTRGISLDKDVIEQNVDSFLKSQSLKNIVSSALPSKLASALIAAAQSSAETAQSILQACVNPDKAEAANIIEEAFVNDILIMLVKCALFLLTFTVLSFVLRLITAATGLINKIPVAGSVNRVLGGAFGILKGGVALVIIAILAAGAASLLGSKYSLFSESTINNSIVFKYFYSLIK